MYCDCWENNRVGNEKNKFPQVQNERKKNYLKQGIITQDDNASLCKAYAKLHVIAYYWVLPYQLANAIQRLVPKPKRSTQLMVLIISRQHIYIYIYISYGGLKNKLSSFTLHCNHSYCNNNSFEQETINIVPNEHNYKDLIKLYIVLRYVLVEISSNLGLI